MYSDSLLVEGGVKSAEILLNGAIHALVSRSCIDSHQSEALIAIAKAVLQRLPIAVL